MNDDPRAPRLSRRALLKFSGYGLGTAALAACGFDPDAAATSESAVTSADWSNLAARLQGSLILPSSAQWGRARIAFNPLYDGKVPAAVAVCASPADVAACVRFAQDKGVPLAPRSGRHSYVGYSTPQNGLVVDLGGMSGITVDGSTRIATIGAGARLAEIYYALGPQGFCVPGGSCPSVGVSGLTLGGGIGVLARLHGLTCDKLVGADIVLADGSVKSVDASHDPDLFWALRGGGGGNFGIVTSFRFAPGPAPEKVTVWRLGFPAQRGAVTAVLAAWHDWLTNPGPPRELWTDCILLAGSTPTCSVGGSFVGSAADLKRHLRDFVQRVAASRGPLPIAWANLSTDSSLRDASSGYSYVVEKSYLDAMRYFGGCSKRDLAACHNQDETPGGTLAREGFVASSCMMTRGAPAQIEAELTRHTGLALIVDSLGGAVAEPAVDATAFPHRKAFASVQIYKGANAATWNSARADVASTRTALASLVGDGAYINYIDPSIPARLYYGDNLGRLQDVSRTYDPHAYFGFARGITQ